MFEQLAARGVLRDAAVVGTTTNVDFSVADRRSGSLFVVGIVAGRSTGTITLSVKGSYDGGSTYPATLFTGSANSDASGAIYCNIAGPIPPDIRVTATVAASWDGTLALYQRSAGLLAQSEQIE
jgi:hypothetical protein